MNILKTKGRGGGDVVSVLAFYSDDPSLSPADAYSFSINFVFENNEKQERGRCHFKKRNERLKSNK